MSDNLQQQPPQKSKKQIPQVFKDPTNIFIVQNPEVLPPLSKQSQDQLKDLLHSTNISGFRTRSINWVTNISKDHRVKEILIKVKQVKNQSDLAPKFYIQLFPQYQKFSFSSLLTFNKYRMTGHVHNLTVDTLKEFQAGFKWNYRTFQFGLNGKLKLYAPWELELEQKWGKPLDKKWTTDCRAFKINYLLSNDSRRVNRDLPSEYCQNSIYWQMKGYQTRLNRTQPQINNIYMNHESLKKIDILQAGYKFGQSIRGGTTKYGIKIGVGSDYYNTWYCKLKGNYFTTYILNNVLGISSYTEMGIIDGKNVIQHEMFSRNHNKWMGERSRMYAHQRFDLFARGIPFLDIAGILPSNYVSFWASRSYENKVKIQAELGISLRLASSMINLDFSLLRLAGVKGQPRFGLKYQF